jgi:hypothetical protein
MQLHWTRDGADWVVKFDRRKLGRVFLDGRYPGMWRVRWLDGSASDTTNRTRAKDAVACFVETDARRQRGGRASQKAADAFQCEAAE